MHVLNILFCVGQVTLAIALIFLVDIQNSNNEGLGGSISGSSRSSFKGKAGFEDRLSGMTRSLGAAFFVVSILVAVTTGR